jgi:Arm DNA-binding domain
MRLTKASIASLTVPKQRAEIIVFDDALPGFGVRKRHHKNSAAYLFQYKVGLKHRRMSLGKCSAIDCETARKHAEKLYARVKLGEDPAGAKVESRSRAAETFGQCVETYLVWQEPQVRAKTFADIKRHLTKNLAALHGLHISNVDKRAIAGQLSRLATSAPVQANRTRASLSRFFNWAAW